MDHKAWKELSEKISVGVWLIECADVMIETEDALRRWEAMPEVGSNAKVSITHTVGCALIAMEKMGLEVSGHCRPFQW
jgi:hypothetical protein